MAVFGRQRNPPVAHAERLGELMPEGRMADQNHPATSDESRQSETPAKSHVGMSILLWVVFIVAGLFVVGLFGMMGSWH